MMLQAGYDPTGSSCTSSSPRSCGLLPVSTLISCHSCLFELALTKSRQPLSSVTSAFIDCDVSVRSHVTKTVSACFAILHQLRSIRRSIPTFVFQSLVSSFVFSQLDYGNATLVGIPLYQPIPAQAFPVSNELRCPAGFPIVEVRPHHLASSRTSLVEGGRED